MDNKSKMLVIYQMASNPRYQRSTRYGTFMAISEAFASIELMGFACLAMTIAHWELELEEREAA